MGQLTRYLAAYAGAAAAFIFLDAIWLSQTNERFYRPLLGQILIEGVRWAPAICFYIIYLSGVTLFAIHPALRVRRWIIATRLGAAFGFVAYATYDLTNQATLITWPIQITLMDLAWGTFVTAAGATAGFLAANRVQS